MVATFYGVEFRLRSGRWVPAPGRERAFLTNLFLWAGKTPKTIRGLLHG